MALVGRRRLPYRDSMTIFVAFLRGMNLGRRRIRNPDLCACFEDMGLTAVSAFLASGNVIFDGGDRDEAALKAHIEEGLEARLDYPVPTYLRSAAEVAAIADKAPFTAAERAPTAGRVQVVLLAEAPGEADRAAVLGEAPADDRLLFDGRELYWLPKAGLSDSSLDLKAIDRRLGGTTVRTHRTITRLRGKLAR